MPDSTLALLRDPYGFIARRCRRHGGDLFATRVLLRPAVCMTGAEAAAFFFDPERFERAGAAPSRLKKTLFGYGGVQGLDGAAHHRRKRIFTSATGPEAVGRLAEDFLDCLTDAAARWPAARRIVLYDELCEVLTRAACRWTGVPLAEPETARRTRDLVDMFEHSGGAGPRYWKARRARRSAGRWATELIEAVRAGRIIPPEDSLIAAIARHRESDGRRLPARVAGVELLNALRPTVAVAVYLVFVAHALHEHPRWERRIHDGADPEAFVQEVRRHYPFFPFLVARVRTDAEWHGYRIPGGTRALLDVYGTNHDPRWWAEPERFMPERFAAGAPEDFAFIPQGGGSVERNHRCPGEPVAVALMRVGADFLTRRVDYRVPPQDLRVDRSKAPALPRSRFVVADVSLR